MRPAPIPGSSESRAKLAVVRRSPASLPRSSGLNRLPWRPNEQAACRCRRASASGTEPAPAASAVVLDDLAEHRQQRGAVDPVPLVDPDLAAGCIAVAVRDDLVGV